MLYAAVFAAVAIGLIHSILGERYILMRLFRRTDLPHLFGSDAFTKQTLRVAWHLTTVAWFGFAAIMLLVARSQYSAANALHVISLTFLISSILALVGSRGRHLSWVVFMFIAVACWYAVT